MLDDDLPWLEVDTYTTPEATEAEVAYAQDLLHRDGSIPLHDEVGHRAAVQMWRDHCRAVRNISAGALRSAVDAVMAEPRPDIDVLAHQEAEEFRWVRPANIMVTNHPEFPYHHDRAELAAMAGRLIAEQGEPSGMSEILVGNTVCTATAPRAHRPT